jgi:hypothetical protein
MRTGQKVELLKVQAGHGLVGFETNWDVTCNGCILRPIPDNDGVGSGCVATSLATRTRILDLYNARVAAAVEEVIDPTKCGILDVLEKDGHIEKPVKVEPVPDTGVEENVVDGKRRIGLRVRRVLGRVRFGLLKNGD